MRGGIKYCLLVVLSSLLLVTSAGASQVYTIRAGDSLWAISKRFGVSIDRIKAANQVSANKPLPIGKELIIPTKNEPQKQTVDSADSKTGHISGSNVVLRSGPGTNNRKLGIITSGTTLRISEESKDWSKVSTSDGREGWVYSPLIKPGESKASGGSADSQDVHRDALIKTALANRGVRYRYGGTSRSGFDCSGFTRYVYSQYGISLPHSSAAQYSHGKAVARNELKEGDLVFFRTTRRGISHVGIYIGGGKFVHASNRIRGVVVDSLGSAYYSARYVGARRLK